MDILPFPEDTIIIVTKVPDNGVVLKLLGETVVENQQLKIDDLENLEAINESGFKGRLSNFKFKTIVPEVKQEPEKYVYLYFKPAEGIPELISKEEDCISNQELNFSDIVDYENKYDNIIFDSIQGNQDEWTINNEPVTIGMVYSAKFIFENLTFKPRTEDIKAEYSILTFSLCKDSEKTVSDNVIIINTVSE